MRLTLLGATGSVGASAVDVMLRHPDLMTAFALVGHSNVQRILELVALLAPEWVIMTDENAALELKGQLPPNVRLDAGMDAAVAAVEAVETDVVLAAMVGSAGLPATLAAVKAGKKVCLANKETLVTAGHIVMRAAADSGAEIIPVDSEHVGVAQCLQGHDRHSIEKIVLTASGGPFLDRGIESLHSIKPAEAIAHPNWNMGAKISVDSATMMNKALELIEAKWLFDILPEKLGVLIHPQSIVHALVHYRDGSVMAQLAEPDMRAPVAYALQASPRIQSGTATLDLSKHGRLEFFPVDLDRFPAMSLVRTVMGGKASLAIAFNAANEVANRAFLENKLSFTAIVHLVSEVLEETENMNAADLETVFFLDAEARRAADLKLMASPFSKWRKS